MIGAKQAVIAGLGVSAVAGGGYGTYYLLQDKTIKDSLISKGITLISSQDEYEVSFIENKGDKELVKLLVGVDENSNAQKGGNALKAWCNKNLDLDLSEKNTKETLPNVQKYCSKPSLTIEARFKKLGKQLLTKKAWAEKAKELIALKEPTLAALKTDLDAKNFESDPDNAKVGAALQKWCTTNSTKNLIEDKEETVWKKMEARCLEDK